MKPNFTQAYQKELSPPSIAQGRIRFSHPPLHASDLKKEFIVNTHN